MRHGVNLASTAEDIGREPLLFIPIEHSPGPSKREPGFPITPKLSQNGPRKKWAAFPLVFTLKTQSIEPKWTPGELRLWVGCTKNRVYEGQGGQELVGIQLAPLLI